MTDTTTKGTFITEPTVHVLATPKFHQNPEFEIPGDGTDSERLGAYAAKRCYRSSGVTGRANRENQRQVIHMKHGSVLEHAHVSLDISGISRNLTLEMNRHRPFNISQESTRYVNIEGEPAFVLSPFKSEIYLRHLKDPTAVAPDEWKLVSIDMENCLATVRAYKHELQLLEKLNPQNIQNATELRKWCRGQARDCLAGSLATAGVWTCNFRGWRNFIELRSGAGAEGEIRRLAQAVFLALEPLAPSYFQDYEVEDHHGFPQYTTRYPKV